MYVIYLSFVIYLSPVFSGWISSLTGLNLSIPVGIMMIIIAALFTASAVVSLVMFKKVSFLSVESILLIEGFVFAHRC